MAHACPECGFDGSALSPADAMVALRSYARRYRSVLVRPPDENEIDNPVTRRGAGGWSALEHAAWAANAIEDLGHQFERVLVHEQPDIDPPPVQPAATPGTSGIPESVLERLSVVADWLADTVDGTTGGQWIRAGRTPAGTRVEAIELLREAVHQGIHHLRAAERVVREVTGRP